MLQLLEHRLCRWLLLALAFAPAAGFACLALSNRMLGDDYAVLKLGSEIGPWQSVLHWRERWLASYSDAFLHGLMGPLDAAAPAISALVMIALWIIGLTWLLWQIAHWLGYGREVALPAAFAALVTASSLNALFSRQSLHWHSAVVEYSLPVALLTLYLALLIAMGRRAHASARLRLAAFASLLLAFVIAGFSEMHIIFQLAFLSLLFLAAISLSGAEARRKVVILLGAGWLGTVASLAVQLTAPSLARRAEMLSAYPQFQPIRDPLVLARFALADTYTLLVDAETLAGFALLFALGMVASLAMKRSPRVPAVAWRMGGDRLPLPYIALLLVQLVFMPLLWTHASDDPRYLGRYSAGFMALVVGNLALIVISALLIWRYRQLRATFYGARATKLALTFALFGFLLLMLPQFRAIDESARLLLFATALCYFAIAWWEWRAALRDRVQSWLSQLALTFTIVALLSTAAIATGPRFFVGLGDPRHWTGAAFLLVSQGLVWGFVIGLGGRQMGKGARRHLRLACGALILIVWAGTLAGQIRHFPDQMQYASEWDDRHSLLIALQDEGEQTAEIPPRAFDLAVFALSGEKAADVMDDNFYDAKVLEYYGMRSITLAVGG